MTGQVAVPAPLRDSDVDRYWMPLIKQLRMEEGISILEAERIALSWPEWREVMERRINSDQKCLKYALGSKPN